MPDPIEAVFYIHGVSKSEEGRRHTAEYAELHNGLSQRNSEIPAQFAGAEWGWEFPEAMIPGPDQLLTRAQTRLGERTLQAVREESDWTVNPARLVINESRSLLMYGFGDMFYYTSANGKAAIRQTVGIQICRYIQELKRAEPNRPVSLTIAGHSAGSIIAFDLLFSLFYPNLQEKHTYLDSSQPSVRHEAVDDLKALRVDAQSGRLRIRRLITFGSPITPLAVRSNAVLEILADDRKLDVSDYGLDQNPDGFTELSGPRWINVWDKDDAIAWPVEPLMEDHGKGLVEDVYVDVSDSVASVHNRYWESPRVHRAIAERW